MTSSGNYYKGQAVLGMGVNGVSGGNAVSWGVEVIEENLCSRKGLLSTLLKVVKVSCWFCYFNWTLVPL